MAAVMEDLNRKAPELATLLRKALRDGFISPDAVIALNRAVEHLNEDTVQAFRFAAEHINEDTAISFQGVAHDFTVADQQLSARVSELNYASEALGKMIEQFNSAQEVNASGFQSRPPSAQRVTIRPSSQSAGEWWLRIGLISFSLGVGLIAARILMLFHQVGPATVVGVFAVIIPAVVFWIAKARR
jgi:hypothetical protein